jgi:GT2 family glycosyltransferase
MGAAAKLIDVVVSRTSRMVESIRGRNADVVVPEGDPRSLLVFPEEPSPTVSIVVPAHNAWAYTHLCLRAILEHTASPRYEVVLADDASTDDTALATELLQNVTVVRDGMRRGYVANCNNAVRRARGRYVVLLNNDTVVQPGWLRALVTATDRDRDVGIVGGRVLSGDGSLQEAGCFVLSDGTPVRRGLGSDPTDRAFATPVEVDYVSGCCLLVRRDLWHRLGGFDARFAPAYYEDVDLAFAARVHRYRVMYEPTAVVLHFGGVTYGQEPSTGTSQLVAANAAKFVSKWRDSGVTTPSRAVL